MTADPQSITVNLESAKKLKEAGWPQDDAYWFWIDHWDAVSDRLIAELVYGKDPDDSVNPHLAAPTAEEILRRLPDCIIEQSVPFALTCIRGINEWLVGYPESEPDLLIGDTLANAVAAMYCYLAEHKLLSQ